MEALGIGPGIFHIVDDGLAEELGGHELLILGLAEIAREELARALEDAQVDDIVIVDILDVKSVFVEGVARHLILRGIDGDVEMVTLAFPNDNGVFFQHFSHLEHLGGLGLEIVLRELVLLDELNQIAIAALEPDEVLGLALDVITRGRTDVERVIDYLKVGGHTGGIGIKDTVALHLEDDIIRFFVHPDSLEQGFGLLALRTFVSTSLAPATAAQREQQDEQYDDNTQTVSHFIFLYNGIQIHSLWQLLRIFLNKNS